MNLGNRKVYEQRGGDAEVVSLLLLAHKYMAESPTPSEQMSSKQKEALSQLHWKLSEVSASFFNSLSSIGRTVALVFGLASVGTSTWHHGSHSENIRVTFPP